MADQLQFGRVLESGSSSKRSLLIVLPVVVIVVIILGFGAVAISRMSSLSTQVQLAQKQAEESQKAADEHDQKLREARAEAGIVGSPGQGAAVLAPASPDSGMSGIAILHPETSALTVFAYNLAPPAEGQEYRVIARDAAGQEKDVAGLKLDDRGASFVLARNLPEGATHVEIAAVPTGGAKEGAARQPVLSGDLPRPGEAGVMAQAPKQERPAAQGRRGRR